MGWRTVIIDSRCIGGLKGLNDNSIAFIEEGNRIELNKDGIVVIDYFFLSQYEKPILSKLYKSIEKMNGNDPNVIEDIQSIYKHFDSLLSSVTDYYNIDFEVDVPTALGEYLKFASLKPQNGFDYGEEGVINFISLIAHLKLYKIIVLVNAKSFFTTDQIEEIFKTCCYNGQTAFFLDNCETEERFTNEIKIVVDEDYYDVLYRS
ncbi:MAG: type II-A CRISPR-associated protein Csn2 [Clostridiales bacterium]|nr:type II-A CRISPR-associated protein Csn2 [Clostridiales bacterium]